MKIAGRKNDGAWFRFNKAIRVLSVTERAAMYSAIYAAVGLTIEGAFGAITALMGEAGVEAPDGAPNTAPSWLAHLLQDTGIPRQIWYGKLSFTTYSRTGEPGAYAYTANYQSEMHAFAKELRKACGTWLITRRQMLDLLDVGTQEEGNPGGHPDAFPDPITGG